jgi:hypothetical protein
MLRMKVRIIGKDLRALIDNRELLNPTHYGSLSIALWSHKLLRWFVPLFLIALAIANLFLLDSLFFRSCLAIQAGFYSSALMGLVLRARVKGFWSIPASFCLVNVAALVGILECLRGHTFGEWKPERSPGSPERSSARASSAELPR